MPHLPWHAFSRIRLSEPVCTGSSSGHVGEAWSPILLCCLYVKGQETKGCAVRGVAPWSRWLYTSPWLQFLTWEVSLLPFLPRGLDLDSRCWYATFDFSHLPFPTPTAALFSFLSFSDSWSFPLSSRPLLWPSCWHSLYCQPVLIYRETEDKKVKVAGLTCSGNAETLSSF